jgi:hypothetical protein
MTENDKYKGIYASPDKYPTYGHKNHGARALGLVVRWQPMSLVDVGCGFNEFAAGVREKVPGIKAVGVDFACPGADVTAEAHALPFVDKEFDVATSFDMLEHLTPDKVDATLTEMARVSCRFIVSISYQPSKHKWEGHNLHPTVRTEEWWKCRLAAAGALQIKDHGTYITGVWAAPLRIKPDASVVLVGNGPSVLASTMGSVIDGFDEVVRFNRFEIKGFEKHVGTRTTLWSSFFKGEDAALPRHHRAVCVHENTKHPDYCTEKYHIPSWYYDHNREAVRTRALWASGFGRDVTPLMASSGMLVTAFLLEVVGVKKVHLAGFDHFSKKKSSQHHYWVPSAFTRPKEHDGDVEWAMFEELRAAGRVAYL